MKKLKLTFYHHLIKNYLLNNTYEIISKMINKDLK